MTRCDYCREWLETSAAIGGCDFYSVDCVAAYQRRLREGTVGKIRCLELGDARMPTALKGGLRKEAAEHRSIHLTALRTPIQETF